MNGKQVGITNSFGALGGIGAGFLTYFAEVSEHISWINHIIKITKKQKQCKAGGSRRRLRAWPVSGRALTSFGKGTFVEDVQKKAMKLTKKDVKGITEMLQRGDKCPMHKKSDSVKALDHVQEPQLFDLPW